MATSEEFSHVLTPSHDLFAGVGTVPRVFFLFSSAIKGRFVLSVWQVIPPAMPLLCLKIEMSPPPAHLSADGQQ